MPPALPLITLLTDFGTKDHFVASMKGVILSINPQARIIDISHEIGPHQISEAVYCLEACYRTFPEGTVHVAVVDPGVGSSRRPLIARSEGYYFIAPDNGLLTPILARNRDLEVRQIENQLYRLTSLGRTFDGRDVFAPAAAWVARQQPFDSFGQLIQDPVRFPIDEPFWEGSVLVGKIVSIDRFGNLISNLTAWHVQELRVATNRPNVRVRVAEHMIDGIVGSYSEGDSLIPKALINSRGLIEIFLRENNAACIMNVERGQGVNLL